MYTRRIRPHAYPVSLSLSLNHSLSLSSYATGARFKSTVSELSWNHRKASSWRLAWTLVRIQCISQGSGCCWNSPATGRRLLWAQVARRPGKWRGATLQRRKATNTRRKPLWLSRAFSRLSSRASTRSCRASSCSTSGSSGCSKDSSLSWWWWWWSSSKR